jgi:type I restriction enzyme S subunit
VGKWEMVRLGDVCDVLNGYAFQSKNYIESGHRIIRITNVQKGVIVDEDPKFYAQSSALDKFELRDKDLLVSLTGNVGRVGLICNDLLPAYLNQRVACLRIKVPSLSKQYLFSSLNSDKFKKAAVSSSKGLAQKNMSTEWLKEYLIQLPPLEVQLQIADVLDRASALIEKRKAQIEKLDLLIKSQFIEMFGDPVRNPMGWEVRKLGEIICDGPQNGLYKPANLYTTDGTGTPILRIDAFYDGKITDIKALKRLICTPKEIERYSLRENDVVINRVNSIEYLGKCAHVTGLFERTVFESNMMRFSINPNILNALYTVTLLCSPYVYNQITRHAKKAVNQASINQSDVQDFDVLVPPLELQNKFAVFVERVEEQKAQIKKSLDLLELCYKSLMWKCFSREVEVFQ